MATIAITQDLTYSGSNLISVHNFNKLIWTFVPTDDTKAITSTVVIGAYTFNGIQTALNTSTTPDTYTFELNVTEILKFFINDFLYKTVADDINASALVKSQLITIHGKEDGVSTDNEALTLYLSHGVNQIGDTSGSNMNELFTRENLTFHYFKDYPWEVYFFVPAAVTPLITVDNIYNRIEAIAAESLNSFKFATIPTALNTLGTHEIQLSPGTQLVTGWTNVNIDTFNSVGNDVTQAISDSSGIGHAITNSIVLVAGDLLQIVGELTVISGGTPAIQLISGGTIISVSADMSGVINQTINITVPGTYELWLSNRTANPVVFNDINCSLAIEYFYKRNPSQILYVKTLNVIDCGGVYIKYLSREGFYRYWLFNKYYTSEQSGESIGSLINYFDTMVGAQSRSKQIGFKNTLKRLFVTSENVSKADREMLIDIYTSPAVYLFIGDRGDADAAGLWVMVEVEGSHQIKEKYNFENISATLILPERYTQRL